MDEKKGGNRGGVGGGSDKPPPHGGEPRSLYRGSGSQVDPYWTWAKSTEYRFYGNPDKGWFPILLELDGFTIGEFANGHVPLPLGARGQVLVSPLFKTPPIGVGSTFTLPLLVDEAFLIEAANGTYGKLLKRFELGPPLKTNAGVMGKGMGKFPPWTAPSLPKRKGKAPPKLPARPVVMGIIDDGLAVAHRRFRDASGHSRIDYFWGQDLPPNAVLGFPGIPSTWGWAYTRADLDYLFTKALVGGRIEEDEVYRLLGEGNGSEGHKTLGRRAAHGTHVMDLACGYEPDALTGDEPRIVAVQLPVPVTEETSGSLLTIPVLAGIIFIYQCADAIGKAIGATDPLPVVINLSYGTMSGPHDGSTVLEWAIDRLLQTRRAARGPTAVVIPSGNSNLARCHATIPLPGDGTTEHSVKWRVLPDDRTPSFVEVWLPQETQATQVQVKVAAPDGTASGWLDEGDLDYTIDITRPGGTAWPVCTLSYPGVTALGGRKMALLALMPSATLDPLLPTAPTGVWTITLRNKHAPALKVEAWVRRDDTPVGFPIRGRQSHFEDSIANYSRFGARGLPEEYDNGVSFILRAASQNGIATGAETVSVAACEQRDLRSAPYSAGGPALAAAGSTVPFRTGPDAAALSEHSVACHGVLGAGTRSGSTVAMNGTSVAAPQVARWIAQKMLYGAAGSRTEAEIEAIIEEVLRAPRLKPFGPFDQPPPFGRGGLGRIVLPVTDLPPANKLR